MKTFFNYSFVFWLGAYVALVFDFMLKKVCHIYALSYKQSCPLISESDFNWAIFLFITVYLCVVCLLNDAFAFKRRMKKLSEEINEYR